MVKNIYINQDLKIKGDEIKVVQEKQKLKVI
jgi:hypothetical protein